MTKNNTGIDNRFSLLREFELEVPEDYNHSAQLASFNKNNKNQQSIMAYHLIIQIL